MSEGNKKQYYVQFEGAKQGVVVDADKYEANKDRLYKEHPNATVIETFDYDGNDEGLNPASSSFIVQFEGASQAVNVPYDAFMQKKEQLFKEHPNARISVSRTESDDYWGQKQQESRDALDAFEADENRGGFIRDYEKQAEQLKQQAISGSVARNADAANNPLADFITQNAKQYDLLRNERKTLQDSYFNNPKVQQQMQSSQSYADRMRMEYMNKVDSSYGAEKHDYRRAAQIQKDIADLYSAVTRYGEEDKNGFREYFKGMGDTFNDVDFWTMGITDTARRFDVSGIQRKLQKAAQDGQLTDAEQIDKLLTPSEKELLVSFHQLNAAQANTAMGISHGYNAGKSAAESLGFMAQFMVSGGIGKIWGSALMKSSNAVAQWLGRAMAGNGAMAKGVENELAKIALTDLAEPVAQAVWHTVTQPAATLNSIAQQMTAVNDEGQMQSFGQALKRGILDTLIENWSESIGTASEETMKLLNLGEKIGKSSLSKTDLYRWANWLHNTKADELIRQAGFNGLISEMGEEWIGNAARVGVGLMDKQEFRQWGGDILAGKQAYPDKDERKAARKEAIANQLEMAASFALMTGINTAVSGYGAVKQAIQYNEAVDKEREILARAGASEEEIRDIFNTKWDTSADIAKKFAPWAMKIYENASSNDQAIEDYAQTLRFAQVANQQVLMEELERLQKEQDRSNADAELSEMTGNTGYTHIVPGSDNETVRTITDENGRRAFIQSESNGTYAVRYDDGSVGFLTEKRISDNVQGNGWTDSGEMSREEFLDSYIADKKAAAENQRMQDELQLKVAAVRNAAIPGTQIKFGTVEAPVMGTVMQWSADGCVVMYPDGTSELKSVDQIGAALNMSTTVLSDAERDEAQARQEIANEKLRREQNQHKGLVFEHNGNKYVLDGVYDIKDDESGNKMATIAASPFSPDGVTDLPEDLKLPVQVILDAIGSATAMELTPEEQAQAASQKIEGNNAAQMEADVKTEEDNVPRDFRGNPLPLTADGEVDQKIFWNKDPEAWTVWNDNNPDRVVDSRAYASGRLNFIDGEVKKLQKAIEKETKTTGDFDKIKAFGNQIKELNKRRVVIASILDNYAKADAAAKEAEQAQAASQKEAERRRIAELNEPQNITQLAAQVLKNVKAHSLNRDDFKRELGWGNTELARFFPWWAKKGKGLTVTDLAESMAEQDAQYGFVPMDANAEQKDTQAARNAIIDVLQSLTRPGELTNYVMNENQAIVEAQKDQGEAEAEREVMARYGLTLDEYNAMSDEEKAKLEENNVETVDNQGNLVDANGRLIVEKVNSIDELTDEDFMSASRSVELPAIPEKVASAIGSNKPVIIKKNVFEKNAKAHKDLSPADGRKILTEVLYSPDLYGQNQKATRPFNWILIHLADKNEAVILEVNNSKENTEIVNWHYLRDASLEQKKKQAIKEGGLILTLSNENAAGNAVDDLLSKQPSVTTLTPNQTPVGGEAGAVASETVVSESKDNEISEIPTVTEEINEEESVFDVPNEEDDYAEDVADEALEEEKPKKSSKKTTAKKANKKEANPEYEVSPNAATDEEIEATEVTEDEINVIQFGGWSTYVSKKTGEHIKQYGGTTLFSPGKRSGVHTVLTSANGGRREGDTTAEYLAKYLKANGFELEEGSPVTTKNKYGYWINQYGVITGSDVIMLESSQKDYAQFYHINYARLDNGKWVANSGSNPTIDSEAFGTKSEALAYALNLLKEHYDAHKNKKGDEMYGARDKKDEENLIKHMETKVLPAAMAEDGNFGGGKSASDVSMEEFGEQLDLFAQDVEKKVSKKKSSAKKKKAEQEKVRTDGVIFTEDESFDGEVVNTNVPVEVIVIPGNEETPNTCRIHLYSKEGKWGSVAEVWADDGKAMSKAGNNDGSCPYFTREDAIDSALRYFKWYRDDHAPRKKYGTEDISAFISHVEGLKKEIANEPLVEEEAEEIIESVVEEAPAIEQPKNQYGANNKLVTNERYEELKKRMRAKMNQLNIGFDPETLAIGCEMAAYHIEAGARKFAEYAANMIADLGDAIRPYLRSFYNGARDLPGMEELAQEMDSYDTVSTFDMSQIGAEAPVEETPVAEQEPRLNEGDIVEYKRKVMNVVRVHGNTVDLEYNPTGVLPVTSMGVSIDDVTPVVRFHQEDISAERAPGNTPNGIADEDIEKVSLEKIRDIRMYLSNNLDGWNLQTLFSIKTAEGEYCGECLAYRHKGGIRVTVFYKNYNGSWVGDRIKVNVDISGNGEIQKNSQVLSFDASNEDILNLIKSFYGEKHEALSDGATMKASFEPVPVGTIETSSHEKTGQKQWIVKPADRVSDEEFAVLKKRAKENDGFWYGRKKGFVFYDEESANNFNNSNAINNAEETDIKTASDTAAIVSEAGSVAEKAESLAESVEPADAEVSAVTDQIDSVLSAIDEQLAILGYYSADSDSKFDEQYGYGKSAQKKAQKDVNKLAKSLAADLGIKVGRGMIAKANIAPAGGEVYFRLPLMYGRELYLDVRLQPDFDTDDLRASSLMNGGANLAIMWRIENPSASGIDKYGINNFEKANVPYLELLQNIRKAAKDYLPVQPSEDDILQSAEKVSRANRKKAENSLPLNGDEILGGLFDTLADEQVAAEEESEPAPQPVKPQKPTEINGYKIGDKVLYSYPGREPAEVSIVDFEEGRPVLDSFSASWITELADWEYISRIEEPQTSEDNGLQRNDAIRSEGSSDSDRSERDNSGRGEETGAAAGQESGGTDTGGKASGDEQRRDKRARPASSVKRNTHNNRAERGTDYAPSTPKARFNANIDAIKLMKLLVAGEKKASKEDMAVLRQFSGWGGLGTFFNNEYSSEHKQLKDIMTDDEFQDASMSINSAYFTPASVIDGLWDIAKRLGFEGGTVLEGSAGIGNILGLMPKQMSEASDISAVEIDSITGNILKLLYPDATVHIKGFQDVKIPNNSVDLAITNVPFVTGLHVYDSAEKDLSSKFENIHDFCIAKNVRKLKEGGIGIFITTSGTLDKSHKLRKWVVNEGGSDFIGAFRLNNETFGGTNATSDILVIRKRVNSVKSAEAIDVSETSIVRTGEYDGNTSWDSRKREYVTETNRVAMEYNSYFVENPQFMAGEMKFGYEKGDKSYRPGSVGLYPKEGLDQNKALAKWVKTLKNTGEAARSEAVPEQVSTAQETTLKEGQILVNDKGEVCVSRGGKAIPAGVDKNKVKGFTKAQCIKDYDALKAAVNDVVAFEQSNADDKELPNMLARLNNAYDMFVKRYGHLNKNTSISFIRNNDVDFASIAALEDYKETEDIAGKKKVVVEKTDIFKKRIIGYRSEPSPQTSKDGVIVSVQQFGRINLPYIAEKLGRSEESIGQEMLDQGLAFIDPASGQYVPSYEYLSGNVRSKLEYATDQNEDGRYDRNIEELKKVVPFDIPAHQIEFSLGSDWISPKQYEDFAKEKFGIGDDFKLAYYGGNWHETNNVWGRNEKNRSAGVTSNIVGKTVLGHELMVAAMNNKSVDFSKKTDEGYIYDKVAQQAAQTRMDEIRDEFIEWLRGKFNEDNELRDTMQKRYNDMFNNYVPENISDEYLQEHLDGANTDLTLYPHQKKAVIRGTTEPLMLAHEVGSGKTFTLISTAMEMRRLGTAKKPMVVVQNSTVGQFVSEAKRLYPAAKVLTVTEADRTKEGRAAFYAKIKYNDWDLIIVPQSVFEMIPDSEERKRAFIQEKIDEKQAVLAMAQEAKADSRAISQIKDEIKALEYEREFGEPMPKKNSKKQAKKEAEAVANTTAKTQKQMDRRTDETSDFDDMGIDALLVDEAHTYKKLGFATNIKRGVKGVDASGSKRSAGLYLKTRSIFDRVGWKNVIFATGTPISNTAAEIWTFMKYLMPADVMKSYHIYYFDDFVKNFGKIATSLEFATNGKFKENTRFSSYGNVPELVRIWSSVCDTVLTKDAAAAKSKDGKPGKLSDKLPKMTGADAEHPDGRPEEIFLPQSMELRGVMKWVRDELDAFEKMSGEEKKENSSIPLVMYGIAKRAAIDTRLVLEDGADDPNSKTNRAVSIILEDLKQTEGYKGTVAVFCDSYRRLDINPKTGKKDLEGFNIFDDIKNKLISAGVPENQIAIVRSGKGKLSDKAKEKLFQQVNDGEVRVIMGSTQTLGTGVNIQQRLHAAIHMDTPDRPMDVTQRNGRILRQGNLHKEWDLPVRVIRMGVEDSLDVTGYQRLDTKSKFINSIMNGKQYIQNASSVEFRTLEEEEDDMYSNPVAVLSGSQYALLKSKAERDLRKYNTKYQQYKQDQIYINHRLGFNEGIIKDRRKRIEKYKGILDDIKAKFPDGKVTNISVNGVSGTGNERIQEIIKEQISAPLREMADRGRMSNYFADVDKTYEIKINGIDAPVRVRLEREYKYDYENQRGGYIMHTRYLVNNAELDIHDRLVAASPLEFRSMNAIIDYFNEQIATGAKYTDGIRVDGQRIAELERDNAEMRKREGKPFADSDKLDEAKRMVDEYTKLMQEEMAEKEKKYAEMEAPEVNISLSSANQEEEEETSEDAETYNREADDAEHTLDNNNPEVIAAVRDALNPLVERLGVPVRYVRGSDNKGHYTVGKNEVAINIGAHSSIEDVIETYLHEAVAHFGLRQLMGDEFDSFIDSVWNNATEGIRRKIRQSMSENGWRRAYATEEYIAELAQKTDYNKNERSLWRKIIDAIRNFFDSLAGRDGVMTDSTIRDILTSSFRNLENGTSGNYENATSNETHFRLREKTAPKKTGIGYKVFFQKNGKLYPPMVANPNGEDTPVGVWLDADAAPIAGVSKTGRPQVKAGGKGTQGGSGQLAYRPGWHLGTIPYAIQFNRKDENGEKTLFPKDFVWAEVEYAADKDYQEEANAEGINASGKYQHSLAGLKRLPEDGFYMYRTNPNPETDPWIITGAMKVNKVLSDEEVDDLVRAAGREPQRREENESKNVANNQKISNFGTKESDNGYTSERSTSGLDNRGTVGSNAVNNLVGSPEARRGIARTAEAGDNGGSVDSILTAEEREELESRGINPDWNRKTFLSAIRNAAKENGVWLEQSYLDDAVEASSHRKNGTSENDVYLSADRKSVIKLNNLSYVKSARPYENMSAFMDRIAAHNALFPEVAYDVAGFMDNSAGRPAMVMTQPFVTDVVNATQEEIDADLVRMGFKLDGTRPWSNMHEVWSNGKYELFDARPANVLKKADGTLYYIDTFVHSVGFDTENAPDIRDRNRTDSFGVTASLPAREEAARKTADTLGAKVEIVERQDMPSGHEFSQGVWADGKIFICPENCADADDAARTVIHEAVGHEGLRKLVGNERMSSFCMELYRNATPEIRQEIVALADKHGYHIAEAVEEYLAYLSETTEFTEPQRTFWEKVVDAVRGLLSNLGINLPIYQRDIKWILWQSYNAARNGYVETEVARARLAHRLGFSMAADRIRHEGQKLVRDRKIKEDISDSAADIYNMSVSTLKARLHEIYVDQYDSVNRLVEAIEKSSGKPAKSYEDIRKALNQYSSKALETGMKWHRNFFTPMLEAMNACMEKAGCNESDIVRYVFLKHGMERNMEFAKRDARSFYRAIFEAAKTRINDNQDMDKDEKEEAIAKEQEKLDKHYAKIEAGADPKFREFRQKDYGGLTSLFSEYDTIAAFNANQETRERYEERVLAARHPKYDTIEEIEAAAEKEVKEWEGRLGDTAANLWKRINGATKETLKQQYEANMLTKAQYEAVRGMFKYYVPMRGFEENTAEDMYSYYMSDQTSTFEAALKRAGGRTSVADNPFSYIGHIYSSSNAANAKNEAKLTLYYFLNNRPDNDIATISEVWYERAGEEDGKAVFKPVYPEMTDDMTGPEAKAAYQRWEQEMKDKASRGDAFRGRKNLKLDSVIHITDQQAKSHVIKLKVGGEDKMIIINGNPRAAQAINGELNFDSKQNEFTKGLSSSLRLLSSLNTTYNPEFVISNLQRDVLMSIMSASVEGSGREFIKNLTKATKVVSMNKAYNNGTLGNSMLERDYREFRENGGMTGYSTVRSLEAFDREIDNYLGEDKDIFDKILDGIHGTFEKVSEFSESIEQISRFAAYLTAKENGKSVVDSISSAKEVTVNFNRKGSAKILGVKEAEALLLKGRDMKDLKRKERIAIMAESIGASALSVIAWYGRGFIMFFNAGIQGMNTVFNLYKKNGRKMAEWTGAYMMLGAMGAVLHAMMDDDDDYLDMPDYERRTNLLIGGNGLYFKWAMPQEMRAFYGLGDIFVNHALGREPHKNIIGESLKSLMDVSPVNPTEGFAQLAPSYLTPVIEVATNKNFQGARIYDDMRFLSEEERKRTPAYKKALRGTGKMYVDVSKLLNKIGNPFPEEDVRFRWLNINPAAVEHLVEGYTGGAGTTIEKIMQFASSVVGNEPLMLRNTPMLRRIAVINDERSRNAHTTDLYYYYKAEAEHTNKMLKSFKKKGDSEGIRKLQEEGDIQMMNIYNSYKNIFKFYDDQLKETDDADRRRELMHEQDAYRKEMITKISDAVR